MVSIWNLGRLPRRMWSGFAWFGIGIGGGLLWTRWWTFGFWRHGLGYFVIRELILPANVIVCCSYIYCDRMWILQSLLIGSWDLHWEVQFWSFVI
jgi:hypothetical protein